MYMHVVSNYEAVLGNRLLATCGDDRGRMDRNQAGRRSR